MKTEALQNLLMEVRHTGSVRVEKKRLLWMLGRINDNQSAWALLLNEWEEVGGRAGDLHGIEQGEAITLINQEPTSVKVWSGV